MGGGGVFGVGDVEVPAVAERLVAGREVLWHDWAGFLGLHWEGEGDLSLVFW